jgi:hypothetical protein
MKLVIISIIVLFGVLTFVFLLFPSHIHVSRLAAVRAPAPKVMGLLNDIPAWKKWNLLAGDAGTRDGIRITVVENTPGSLSTRWTKNTGKSFTGKFNLTEMPDGVMVEWDLDFPLRWYPWERLSGMFYEKEFGPLMDQSLSQLKILAEHE